jgi:murein DD-endopeptidase MepM/ murein hydrolase activator NlpD
VLPFITAHVYVHAETQEELQDSIDAGYDRLDALQKEIDSLKGQLQEVGAQKGTLQQAINELELERKKIQADIAYTQNKIGTTDLEISKINLEIGDTEQQIVDDRSAVAEILRRLNEADDSSLIESLLRYRNLSEFWNTISELQQVRDSLGTHVEDLQAHTETLGSQRDQSTEKRSELVQLQSQYSDQNKVLESNTAQKTQLLEETKNKESTYQAQLAQKQATYDQLQSEVRSYESKLQFLLDPSSIPVKGSSVFQWPLDNIIVTQFFGGTEFASRNAAVYGGRPYHPGVDFGAPVGTPIHAPLSGTVRATGNTDEVPGCLSWGKWTLIDHDNGLTTLYAHQSVISVTPGQKVQTGDVIGYTGATGYVTGPHLHFTVYARYDANGSPAVSVQDFSDIKSVTSCGGTKTPVAATNAYLDPMDYLPPYNM